MENQNMTAELKERQMRREYAFYRFADFINGWDIKRGKGARYRGKLRCFLRICSTRRFDTEEEEYETINKFGRGYWHEESMRGAFTEREIDECIVPIAQQYGAFDY